MRKLIVFLYFIFFSCICLANESVSVVTTIKPFYNILSAILKDTESSDFIIKGNNSPHSYALKPSDVLNIQNAKLVIWGGDALEPALAKAINNRIKNNKPVITAINVTNLWKINKRNSKRIDPHIWLSPYNAETIATEITGNLIAMFPQHAEKYRQNLADFIKNISELDKNLHTKLNKVKSMPYLVFHDAYQYFEDSYGLAMAGTITLDPEIPLSAKRVIELENMIKTKKIKKIFSEPQFEPKIVNILIKNTNIIHSKIDPIGDDKDIGPKGYFILMNNIADSFAN